MHECQQLRNDESESITTCFLCNKHFAKQPSKQQRDASLQLRFWSSERWRDIPKALQFKITRPLSNWFQNPTGFHCPAGPVSRTLALCLLHQAFSLASIAGLQRDHWSWRWWRIWIPPSLPQCSDLQKTPGISASSVWDFQGLCFLLGSFIFLSGLSWFLWIHAKSDVLQYFLFVLNKQHGDWCYI